MDYTLSNNQLNLLEALSCVMLSGNDTTYMTQQKLCRHKIPGGLTLPVQTPPVFQLVWPAGAHHTGGARTPSVLPVGACQPVVLIEILAAFVLAELKLHQYERRLDPTEKFAQGQFFDDHASTLGLLRPSQSQRSPQRSNDDNFPPSSSLHFTKYEFIVQSTSPLILTSVLSTSITKN